MRSLLQSKLSRRHFFAQGILALSCWFALAALAYAQNSEEKHWYKGHTHCHSFWSDGGEFPEMVADRYKKGGYDFLVISDHNILQCGEHWANVKNKEGKVRISDAVIERCRKRFGKDAVEIRTHDGLKEVRLKTLEETRKLLEEPGKFLLIEGEEVTGSRVHMNALNISQLLQPVKEEDVAEYIRKNTRSVDEYAAQSSRTVVAHVNHPNWSGYRVSAVDLAAATEARFFEVCNCIPSGNHQGDAEHPGEEKLWDIANTLRLAHWKAAPIFGIASDDAHSYGERFGQGWIVVRAAKLEAEELMKAMQAGDFYASTGVVLDEHRYDPTTGKIHVQVRETPGAEYRIEFLGTLRDAVSLENLAKVAGNELKVMELPEYARVGEVLKTVEGPSAEYQFTGKEFYVRVAVHSTKKLARPPKGTGRTFEEAWCQPLYTD